jgi:hypothetical protein
VNLFPNPAHGQLTVSFGAPFTGNVEIFDANGKLVRSNAVNEASQQEIDLGGFATGIYLVRISNDSWSETKRIVVE